MLRKSVLLCTALVVVGCAVFFFHTPDAWAQDDDLASRRGISGSLSDQGLDEKKMPSKPKMYFAAGSLLVAIAVLKWA